ncbi:hypothetical protein DPEC_G00364740 [Dallia pectoralis]|nr:hypothetical protein DPEC_G00364740 [Dallia pectoralis]
MSSAATGVSGKQLVRSEKELAEAALKDRGSSYGLENFRRVELCSRKRGQADSVDYERYQPEEIVNTFSPALSLELLLYNALGSSSESATCLVRYLVNYYSSNQVCEHIKTTLRNMIRWTIFAGFVPCVFLPWKKLRVLGLGLSGKATVTNLVSANPAVHREAYRNRGSEDALSSEDRCNPRIRRRIVERRERHWRTGHAAPGELFGRGRDRQPEPCFRTLCDGLEPPDAAFEAVQERNRRLTLAGSAFCVGSCSSIDSRTR